MSPLEQNSEELPDAGTAEDTGHDWRREKEEIDAFKREARLHAQRRLAERDSLVEEDESPGTGDSPGNSPNPAHAYDEERRARRAAALSRAKLSKYGETLGSGKGATAPNRINAFRHLTGLGVTAGGVWPAVEADFYVLALQATFPQWASMRREEYALALSREDLHVPMNAAMDTLKYLCRDGILLQPSHLQHPHLP